MACTSPREGVPGGRQGPCLREHLLQEAEQRRLAGGGGRQGRVPDTRIFPAVQAVELRDGWRCVDQGEELNAAGEVRGTAQCVCEEWVPGSIREHNGN